MTLRGRALSVRSKSIGPGDGANGGQPLCGQCINQPYDGEPAPWLRSTVALEAMNTDRTHRRRRALALILGLTASMFLVSALHLIYSTFVIHRSASEAGANPLATLFTPHSISILTFLLVVGLGGLLLSWSLWHRPRSETTKPSEANGEQ